MPVADPVDIVYIKKLKTNTVIGVYEAERHIRQDLYIDLELGCDVSLPGKTDSVADALDYDAVARRTREFVEHSEYQLIESVAEQLSRLLLNEFAIEWLRITVSKPGALSTAEDTGVTIERRR